MRYVISALLAMALTVPVDAGQRAKKRRACRARVVSVHVEKTSTSNCTTGKCGTSTQVIEKVKTRTVTKGNRQALLQAWAEEECRLQARNGRVGHFRPTPAGARFVGCGRNGMTCMTSGTPIAVAHIGGYSVRVW
ncbi:MAG: hypothetical protein ABGZ35_09410 [Planctomycetaceae bacterium]